VAVFLTWLLTAKLFFPNIRLVAFLMKRRYSRSFEGKKGGHPLKVSIFHMFPKPAENENPSPVELLMPGIA